LHPGLVPRETGKRETKGLAPRVFSSGGEKPDHVLKAKHLRNRKANDPYPSILVQKKTGTESQERIKKTTATSRNPRLRLYESNN